ncbi:TPA: type IV pilin [Methanosarcina acetivorans]|uniref:Type IV pilin n=1 Tax=Methanosarcina acetivorans TaxID=2214 RepID=A0A832SJK0_9EURY|nr:type IV pilin N-terminal domain-containing protein [Methanosarcina acetivorans]HIH94602.1 type IV pilin [Methanosarcina acetivorans]
MNILEKFMKDSIGVSSVMGEVLIAGIIVIAFGSLFVIMTYIDKPVDSTRLLAEEWIDAPSDTIFLRHAGGEPIDTKDLKINVQINGTNYVYSSSNISENLGGQGFWELADVIQIDTIQEWGIGIENEEGIDVKLVDTSSKEVLPKYRIGFSPESSTGSSEDDLSVNDSEYDLPEDPVDFEIIEDTVVPQEDFISSFTVLGAAIQSGGYDLKVTTQFIVGDDILDPWQYSLPVTGNVNDEEIHVWNLSATYPAGTPVTINCKSWIWTKDSKKLSTKDSDWKSYMEVSSSSYSSNLIVLRNGDAVPTIPGLDEQPDVAEFIEDYVGDGKLVLEGNEAIFLFELGTTDLHSSAADFQDFVVLMSIDPAPEN